MSDREDDEPEEHRENETDDRLRRAVAGDEESLAWVVEHFAARLLMFARRRLGGALARHIDAEDVAGMTWYRAIVKLHVFRIDEPRPAARFFKFLQKICLNNIAEEANRLRRREVEKGESSLSSDDSVSPIERLARTMTGVATRLVRGEEFDRLVAALERLGETDRTILYLRYVDGLTNVEAAELLGIEPNAAAARLKRARKKLRDDLGPSFFDDDPE